MSVQDFRRRKVVWITLELEIPVSFKPPAIPLKTRTPQKYANASIMRKPADEVNSRNRGDERWGDDVVRGDQYSDGGVGRGRETSCEVWQNCCNQLSIVRRVSISCRTSHCQSVSCCHFHCVLWPRLGDRRHADCYTFTPHPRDTSSMPRPSSAPTC